MTIRDLNPGACDDLNTAIAAETLIVTLPQPRYRAVLDGYTLGWFDTAAQAQAAIDRAIADDKGD